MQVSQMQNKCLPLYTNCTISQSLYPQILFGDLGHTQWYIGVTPESAQGTICNAQD